MPYRPLPESWIDPLAAQLTLGRLSPEPLDITGSSTPSGLRELAWPEDGVRDFRLPLHDDRTLALQTHGDEDGYPIVLAHGTPSGRFQRVPPARELSLYGFQIISYDRPGYGDSDRNEGRTIADVAGDVGAIAEALDLENFSVIGRSGGAAGALACAALLGNRPKKDAPELDRTVTLAAGIPPEAKEELDLYEGLGEANTADKKLSEATLIAELTARAEKLQVDPWYLLRDVISKDFTDSDYRIARFGSGARIAVSQALAVRDPSGYIDDVLAARRSWGFDLKSIAIPVHLWGAADDPFCPPAYTQWLARQITGAGVTIQEGASHFTAMDLIDFLHACFGDIAESHARSIGKSVMRLIPASVFDR